MQNPVWSLGETFRKDQFRWQVYCGACDPPEGGIQALFWGGCLGGTNDWNHAAQFAQEHARAHKVCGECGRIKPVVYAARETA
jgi:hypothetical protein